MSAIRDTGNASRVLKGAAVRTPNGLLQAKGLYARDASNASRSVLATLAATASPSAVYGYAYSKPTVSITTSQTTVTATGASSPTYAWTGGDANWTITNPSSATTAFRRNAVGGGGVYDATFTCTVTDGGNVVTVTVHAEVGNNYNA